MKIGASKLPRQQEKRGVGGMTVCIAAVCNILEDRPPCVLVAADRMITIGDIEYEPAQTKSVFFAQNTVGLFAGDMQLHVAIIPKVQARIDEALREHPENINVSQIAEFYAEEFAFYRRTLAEREILYPRGLSFDRFLTRQGTMAHWQVNDLDSQLAAYYLDSTAIIAGIDPTGAHIYKIQNPGVAMCFDTPFFACTGAGASLATTQFMVASYDKMWPVERALWLTFVAKARAEMAGGVGRQTDMAIISPGRTHIVTYAEKEWLYELFKHAQAKENAAAAEAIEAITSYMKAEATKEERTTALTQTGVAEQPASNDERPRAKKRKKSGRRST